MDFSVNEENNRKQFDSIFSQNAKIIKFCYFLFIYSVTLNEIGNLQVMIAVRTAQLQHRTLTEKLNLVAVDQLIVLRAKGKMQAK